MNDQANTKCQSECHQDDINVTNSTERKLGKRMFTLSLTFVVIMLMLFSGNFILQTLSATGITALDSGTQANETRSTSASESNVIASHIAQPPLWQDDSKSVSIDEYINQNQVSQNIIDKKQRVMLEPELIDFTANLQAKVVPSKASLVIDALSVWGISPLPEVAHSTFLRTPNGNVIGVYVEKTIAERLSSSYQLNTSISFQAYRLYNYAKGPRLLLVGVKSAQKRADPLTKKSIELLNKVSTNTED